MSRSKFDNSFIQKSILSCMIFFFVVSVYAVPACPNFYEVRQPNGTKLQIKNMGDEFYNWKQTKDGYPVQKNSKTSVYEYLKVNNEGKFENTGKAVGSVNPEAIGLQKNAREAKNVILEKISASPLKTVAPALDPEAQKSPQKAAPQKATAIGLQRMAVILAQFSDASPIYTKADYQGLFSTVGFNSYGANGSVEDYYNEASYNNLDLQVTVYGWVVLPNNRAYYADKPGEMVTDAINGLTVADKDDIKTRFDTNGDGKLDIELDVIHSGYGQEETGDTNDIWSHKWNLTSAQAGGDGNGPVNLGGVIIDGYHTEPAKRVGGNIVTIGVICHEAGHSFGLPDLYDTSGNTEGLGSWALMAAGSWNGGGARPAHFCSWSKDELNWLTPTTIDVNKTGVTLARLSDNAKAIKVIRDMPTDEYLLIENRSSNGFDDSLPGYGLLIYHIDDNIDPGDNTDNNSVIQTHPRVVLLQADGNGDLEVPNNRGDAGDPFPGSSVIRKIDSTTTPDTDSYTGATSIVISNISNAASNMSFDLQVSNASYTVTPTTLTFKEDTTDTPESALPAAGTPGTGTFDVVLDVQPDTDVVFNVTSGDTNEATVDKATLTFTNANWNVAQTVTVTAVDDIYAGDDTVNITISVDDANSDNDFDTLADQAVAVTMTSDEIAGITVTESGGTTTMAENGGTDTFTVELDAKPRTSVTVMVTRGSTTECTVDKSSLIFTTDNWNVAQTVTITGIDDSFVGADTETITMSVKDNVSDNAYDSVADATVTATFTDDEGAGGQTADFTVTESGGNTVVAEAGGTDTFTVVLNGSPHTNVILNVVSADTAEAKVNRVSLTFTPANWNVAQTITVTGINDNLVGPQTVDIDITVNAASDSHFVTVNDTATVTVTCTDDDVAAFSINKTAMNVSENGGINTFTVVLTKGPTGAATVELDITSGDVSEATVTPSPLTFNTANWNTPQTVTVTGVDDDTLGNDTVTVTISVDEANTDDTWDLGATPPPLDQTVTCTLINDDKAGFTLTPKTLAVPEGGANTFTVVLNAEPDSNVVFNIASNDIAEATIAPATLTFTPANWDTPQTITVTGVDDDFATDDKATVSVSVDGANSDNNFDALATQSVAVTVTNDDPAGFTIVGGPLTIVENGGSDTFTVQLDAKPHSNVVISVTSLSPADATVDKATLTFTPDGAGAWNLPQTVTVTAVDDDFSGDDTTTIRMRIVDGSSDNTFDALADQTVAITCTDDEDAEGFILTSVNNPMTPAEAGGKDTFTLVLTGRPHTTVYLDITSSDTTQAKVSRSYCAFTNTNWNVPQTVTVTAVNDKAATTDTATITVSLRATSDAAWVAAAPANQTVVVNPVNDDQGAFSISSNVLTVQEAGGGTNTFTVVLANQPTNDVVIDVSDPGAGVATALPTPLTFTNGNWNNPQTVTVTSLLNDGPLGNQTFNVTLSVNGGGSDATWVGGGVAAQVVAVTIVDDDPTANDDTVTVAEGGTVIIRPLNNDTDPNGDTLTIAAIAGADVANVTGFAAGDTTLFYTPAGVAGATETITYTITDSSTGDNATATITINIIDAIEVTCGSYFDVAAGDLDGAGTPLPGGVFTRRPRVYATYTDPISARVRSAYLTGLTAITATNTSATSSNEWRTNVCLYDRRAFSLAYRNGTKFKNFTGQVDSLTCTTLGVKTYENATAIDDTLDYTVVIKPPSINDVVSFDTTTHTALGTAGNKLHKGSIILIRGKYFGSKVPKVWFEYTNSRGSIAMARCRVLRYMKYNDSKGNPNKSYMEGDENVGTYGDSELKVQLPTRWPRDWVHGANDLVIDNRIGMATTSLITVATSDANAAPTAAADAGVSFSVAVGSRNNELDILDNDFDANGDYLDVTIAIPPDNGGRVRWDRNKAKIIYTPAAGFTGTEIFTYRVTEKYTDGHLSTTGQVTITVP